MAQSSNDGLVLNFKKQMALKRTYPKKEKIENEENIVKGFVLKGEKKIGYILLPGILYRMGKRIGLQLCQ